MKRRLAIVLVLACLAVPAAAQEPGSPEALRAASELLSVMSPDMTKQLAGAVTAQMWSRVESEMRNKVDAATLNELRGEYEKALTRFLDDIMKEAPPVYARHFSAPELHDIAAFYRTPTGMKSLRLMPTISAETIALLVPRLPVFQQDVQGIVEAVLQKRGYKK